MTECGYDASTLGNHEFDNGASALANVLQFAKFDMVNCNFAFSNSPLESIIKQYTVKEVGPIKVGITGVGIDFVDLVAKKNHEGVSYLPPFERVQSVVNHLRNHLGCDLIVVLSHLGYKYSNENTPSDIQLAQRVNGIDWIVGGHTHTFMDEPLLIKSVNGHPTNILQVGWAGILLGKTDFYFRENQLVSVDSRRMIIDRDTDKYLHA